MSDFKREQRKNEHVEIAMAQTDATISDFDEIRFVHHSIPSIDVSDINLESSLKDFTLSQPLYINAMTGGSEWTKQINEKLAMIARESGMAMAVGSTHAALRNSKMASSFTIVRETNPNGIIFSNVGADVPVDKAVESVHLLDAQALQVHVNAPQELVMPEGNRIFSTWMDNLAQIVARVDVPVIIKEVGFGMSKETIKQLHEIGIRYVDVSGRGGTNFVDIENERRSYKDMDYLSLWGQTTVESLLESTSYQRDMDILASGGVRSPLDVIKCLALGASAVGMSRPFLNQVENYGITETLNYTEQFTEHMKKIMTMLDARSPKDLKNAQMIFGPKLQSWIDQRNIDIF
ncbi:MULTISPECIES: type 2 isopentenyl-diphosphate Delta-isomerase [Staphylococcus]|jgi:isopentenyl-diphosphate delta-isomerase|uniref:Isopentenyl-diphosphate delta-isomerase n=1 Tax=Staphylococcus nepalensis TaxID=214473 RepID=A0A2T4S8Q6_9STAP|nr:MULTISPECIES: type 2 isopentenyl-diphosphate Delta-isomerase [Staphylococcus]VDG66335.1 dehydrogenase [Lacrimispora indolis]MBO1205715.1 type 2 isopentenyl-diphosphate Delta-isomerase [Staphylococcus nepalensis]MBO1212743.1 type 2 isopentenyl-diphosphate Delta-isomerase [Staphylococcus nepalensis]MBO1215812.1 type 2 isopentenyl-diphosphate Delta-isomerase [Staphylococcus nepalensis]MBO1221179.1 type 2 isopentenyl-diphosphate Delta-isomerase [Staphylococcus nepalensis]